MNEKDELFVHGTCRKFARKIVRQCTLQSSHGEIWAAVASDRGMDIAAYFARETAAREADEPVLVFFRTDAVPDELRYFGEAVQFYEWEHCWHTEALPVHLVGVVHGDHCRTTAAHV